MLIEELDTPSVPDEAEIKEAVDDIFIELEDEGYTVFKRLGYSRTNEINFYLEVRITKGDEELFDTNEREGSGIWRFYDDKVNRMFDKQHSKEMGEFVNDLYNVLI